jgi:hypothetical protein
MSSIFVRGIGAVSPAGWGVAPLRQALRQNTRLPLRELACPGPAGPLKAQAVPVPPTRPAFAAHGRLRRTSPIGQYAVGAALEALGPHAPSGTASGACRRLGIVYCAMSGCVNFSRRFYDETLKDPSMASPIIFPETVFNAPASHLAALLGSPAINYTLVGDAGMFLQGLALAADWLLSDRVDGCLVVAAEELDWLVANAFGLFDPEGFASEGAAALYLRRESEPTGSVELAAISQPYLFFNGPQRLEAARKARAEIRNGPAHSPSLLCDGVQGVRRLDRAEQEAWRDWLGGRLSPKLICGEAFMAAAAWQCVAAVDALNQGQYASATVSIVGCNQQAIAARFELGRTKK